MFQIGRFRIAVQIIFFIITLLSLKLAPQLTTRLTIAGLLLLVGTYYCGWICIFGTLQDFIYERLGKYVPYKFDIPHKYNRYLLWFRYLTLFVTMTFVTKTLYARGTFFSLIFGKKVAVAFIVAMVFFLLWALITPRPFCRYFCVQGAKYSAIGVARFFTVTRKQDTCINCKKCDRVCPMGIEVSQNQSMYVPHCISCGRCIDGCPVPGTLSMKLRSFVNWQNLILFSIGMWYAYTYISHAFIKFGAK